MLVLVIGASGFIGLPIAQALVRAGHAVYGLTRSEAKAKQLATEEIIPVVGEPANPITWVHLVAALDVVIDAVGGNDIATLSDNILSAVSAAAGRLRPASAPRLSFIYSSGTWVHGENRKDLVTDTTPTTSPARLVAWRVDQEQRVVENLSINGIVIRPAMLYGRAGSLLAPTFASAAMGSAQWHGKPGGRLALIHPEDLADLYVRATEKAQLVGGKIFDAANDFTESVDDILGKLVEVSGAQGPPEYLDPAGDLFLEALGTTTLLRPYLARALLDWQPKKPGLVEGMSVYYAAWRAAA